MVVVNVRQHFERFAGWTLRVKRNRMKKMGLCLLPVGTLRKEKPPKIVLLGCGEFDFTY